MARRRVLRPRKKLKDAGAYWARGGKRDDKAREDLKSFGATDAQIELQLGPKDEGFEVWPENWDAFQAFSMVQTQWASGFAGPTGLDYARARAGLEMGGVSVTRELFDQLRVIEAGALDALAAQAKKPS